ncbi:MAG: IS66 family transposase [Pirellulaceae bacterium]|nr:IS66 family transposase [Pirellulaceae bacterium]
MSKSKTVHCSECGRLQKEVERLKGKVASLEAELAKARKHSGNSSKPPSGDIVKPPRPKPGSGPGEKRKRGGQPGHERHQRVPFSADEIVDFLEYRDGQCPCCGGVLHDVEVAARTLQQVDLEEILVRVREHRSIAQQCQECRKLHFASFPPELVRAGLAGPRLTALVGFLKGACHMSFSALRKFFRDVVGFRISRGQLAKLVGKVTHSLRDPFEELLRLLPQEDRLNVDETGHKDNGRRLWTWCFRATMFTLFKISPSRGSKVLLEVLGEEFDGVLGCDYFSAYRKYMRLNENVALQFCLAHLIRDVKFLAQHPDPRNRAYGERLLEHFRKLFHLIHRREEYSSEQTFRRALQRVRNELVCDATIESPLTRESENLADRFYLHIDSYFRFITTPGIEPTNNFAEQAIRFVAIHRRLTQGTRGEAGQTWCERIWTAIATCEQQGRSVFHFLAEAVTAYFASSPAPSLVPDT